MSKVTYVPINGETGEYVANGRDFDNHADAYIAALTDGAGKFERDEDGYLRAVENGKQIYQGGSFNKDEQAAKDAVVREIARQLSIREYRFTTLKVERSDNGKIVKIDDEDSADLIAYWNGRIG